MNKVHSSTLFSFIAWPMQSQSLLEQNILATIKKNLPAAFVSGLVVKDNRVLLSMNIQPDQVDDLRDKVMPLLKSIDKGLSLSIFPTMEKTKIKYVIAVASGKGGVGKSTLAVNLAFAFSQIGLKVALLDADIYGPSIPHMLGLEKAPVSLDGKLMQPEVFQDVECMSMGLLIPNNQPAIWRGPMVIKALNQMLGQVAWGECDIMVIDMPPGTGDAQLTLAQNAKLAGVVVVSTPQDLALIDARKGLRMFQTLGVPILGIVENMSSFFCPHCGENTAIFHHGGDQEAALADGIPFLGEIPLYLGLRESGDQFEPFVISHKEHDISQKFRAMAHELWGALNAKEDCGQSA